MLNSVSMADLRSSVEQHLLMVEEVLGGLDMFVQCLDGRLRRIEKGLGLEEGGVSTSGWVADLERVKAECARFREARLSDRE